MEKPGAGDSVNTVQRLRNFVNFSPGWALLWSSLALGVVGGLVIFFTVDGGFSDGGWPQFWFDVLFVGVAGCTVLAGFVILTVVFIVGVISETIHNPPRAGGRE